MSNKHNINFPAFCWCGMCGYNAKVKPEDFHKFTAENAQIHCGDCGKLNTLSFLSFGSEKEMEDDGVNQDEPMLTYPETYHSEAGFPTRQQGGFTTPDWY